MTCDIIAELEGVTTDVTPRQDKKGKIMNNQNAIAFAFDERVVRLFPTNSGSFVVVAKDVADSLEYRWNGSPVIAHVPDEWKGVRSVLTPGGSQELLTLTEEGLYFFLARSDKPKARPFQKWLAGEVLPSIRKNGSYGKGPSIGHQLSAHGIRLRLLDKLEVERHPEKRRAIHEQLDHASRLLGVSTPAINAIGHAEEPAAVPAVVEAFWEAVELIGLEKLNHARQPGLIAISLIHFQQVAGDARLKLPALESFRRVLRLSASPRFVAIKTTNSALLDRSVKCWVFAADTIETAAT